MSTGTAVATTERRSVIRDMAHRYGMEPEAFEATVRATCMPVGRDVQPMTREEFAAGIMVAENYTLNPILREIYFYPRKGGGIVPVVSIDGWLSLINRRKELDGIEFDELHDEKGKLVSITCRIYRTDRTHATIVTEHLSECIRDTIPWKMPHRMLRHKALIQCARYAFGFAGIHDEDEAERILEATAVQVSGPTPPPANDPAPKAVTKATAPPAESRATEAASPAPAAPPVQDAEIVETPSPAEGGGNDAAAQDDADRGEAFDGDAWLAETAEVFASCKTAQDVDEAHDMFEETVEHELNKDQRYQYEKLHTDAMMRTKGPSVEQSTVAAPPPADDDDDFPGNEFIESEAKAETAVDRIRASMLDPARTSASLKQIYADSLDDLNQMIADGSLTRDAANEIRTEVRAESVRLKALNQDVAPAEPSAPPAGPSAPPSDEDPAAAFDRDFRAKISGCGTVEDLNSLSTNTLKERNAFGSTHALYDGWREAVSHRRKQLSGIA